MAGKSRNIDRAVSGVLRDSLKALQAHTEELNRAVADLAAACAGDRPGKALSPMLRAQAGSASLAASLEVLSRFVASSLGLVETFGSLPASNVAEEEAAPNLESVAQAETPPRHEVPVHVVTEAAEPVERMEPVEEALPPESLPAPEIEESFEAAEAPGPFDLAGLPADERDLHRRADRVAKVAMQDIKMLHPDQVRLGKERKDLCRRLHDDIEKAHKEYERRFHSILDHPVDYFYNRMVEILGDGDEAALGEYPYPSPVLRR
jgi:hypothetical protein